MDLGLGKQPQGGWDGIGQVMCFEPRPFCPGSQNRQALGPFCEPFDWRLSWVPLKETLRTLDQEDGGQEAVGSRNHII